MAIDSINQTLIQSQLSVVQQRNAEEETNRLKEKNLSPQNLKEADESEVLLVDPKEGVAAVENSELEPVKAFTGGLGRKIHKKEEEVVKESYLGRNIDLKG
jgi:hypothetical protein